jgi:hypothetical protein
MNLVLHKTPSSTPTFITLPADFRSYFIPVRLKGTNQGKVFRQIFNATGVTVTGIDFTSSFTVALASISFYCYRG